MHLLPTHLQHLDEEHGLGRPETVYAQRVPRIVFLTLACILMLLAVSAGFAGFLYPTPGSALPTLAYYGQDVTAPLVVTAILFLLAMGAGALFVFANHKAYVFANGFVITRGGRVDAIIRWDEIDSVVLSTRYSPGSVSYHDRSGTPRTYSFWSFAGKLKHRCAVELTRRGKDAPYLAPKWATVMLVVGIFLPWVAMGGGIAGFGQGLVAGLLALIGSVPFVLSFGYLGWGQWVYYGRRRTARRAKATGRPRQPDKPAVHEKSSRVETVLAIGVVILLLGFLAWWEVAIPALIAFGVNTGSTQGHSHH